MSIKKLKEKVKAEDPSDLVMRRVVFAVCFFVSVGLIVGGFFVPPTGVIDGSVLTSVGELLLFPTLLYGFRAVEMGLKVKFQKGETAIEIGRKKGEDEECSQSS